MDAIRAKSVALTELIVALHDEWLAPLGFELGSPREAGRRGSHVSLAPPAGVDVHPRADRAPASTPDFRGPDSIRLGVAPLYTATSRSGTRSTACARSRARDDLPDARPPASPSAAVAVLGEHELLGQRDPRRRRRVGA